MPTLETAAGVAGGKSVIEDSRDTGVGQSSSSLIRKQPTSNRQGGQAGAGTAVPSEIKDTFDANDANWRELVQEHFFLSDLASGAVKLGPRGTSPIAIAGCRCDEQAALREYRTEGNEEARPTPGQRCFLRWKSVHVFRIVRGSIRV
jgi:hypothetical protein